MYDNCYVSDSNWLLLQLALDTFYWNPIQHVFVWGSILAWFVVLALTSSPPLYIGGINTLRFDFLGVLYEVIQTATFWFYWPLATVVALGPTIVFRTLHLDLYPRLVDDVRLKMKEEGPKLFRRAMLKKKLPRISLSAVKERTGYAFSHQGGFGRLILSGRMFGGKSEEQVHREREQRLSTIIRSASTSPVPPHRELDIPQSNVQSTSTSPVRPHDELDSRQPTVAHLTVHPPPEATQQQEAGLPEVYDESITLKHEPAPSTESTPVSTPQDALTESARALQEPLPGSVSVPSVQMGQLSDKSDDQMTTSPT